MFYTPNTLQSMYCAKDPIPKESTTHAVYSVKCKTCKDEYVLDMAKAFDRVDHQLFLKKLRSIGVLGPELEWFTNYLFNRLLCTRVDNVCSSLRPVSSSIDR